MGNLSSQEEDSYYTDDSLSLMSEQSARMQRPTRRGPNVPIEPPEADLSHLTEQERAHILSVLARARDLQARDERRVRDLEDDFSNYAASVLQRASNATASEPEASTGSRQGDLCPICHVTELVPDPQPGTASEGQPCGDCDRIVCLQCGFYTPAMTSDTETWLCNMCQRRRRFLATSGLWHVGRRNKRFSGSKLQRRSSLDETESALKRASRKAPKLERMASYSQYEDMRSQPGQQEGASPLSPLEAGSAASSSTNSASAFAEEPRRVGDGRESVSGRVDSQPPSKPPRSISREDEMSEAYPKPEPHASFGEGDPRATLPTPPMNHRDNGPTDVEAVASASTADKMQATPSNECEVDVDEEEMMRQLMEMAEGADGGDAGDGHRGIPGKDSDRDFDMSQAEFDDDAEPVSIETDQADEKQSYLQRRFGDLDVLYEGDERDAPSDRGDSRESSSGAKGASVTALLTEREQELIRESCGDARSKTRGFVSHRSSSVDRASSDEPKQASRRKILSTSFDSYECHSDSELKLTKSKQSKDVKEIIALSGSDPKLSLSVDSSERESLTLGKDSLQKLYVPLSPDEFATDEKYRSVEDLTKVGTDEQESTDDSENGSTRIATPAVGQPQFQYVKQKPNSLPRRRRSRPVMELPLSPIFDEEAGSPDPEHPAGDFSSPEYADPSLAEDSPFEYEYDDDADASQEGFSSQDELPRTEMVEDLKAMEEEVSDQRDYDNDYTLIARDEGLATLVEEQEETPDNEIQRGESEIVQTETSFTHSVDDSIVHTIPSARITEAQQTQELPILKSPESKKEKTKLVETADEVQVECQAQPTVREHIKHLPRHSQDDGTSSSSLTSSQSSEEAPDTVRSNKDEKASHSPRPKPPPLGMMPPRYSMEAYSSLESEEGNSLLSSPRTPSYDTDSFDKPKVTSPGKKHMDLDSPLSPSFRFSPPATPKHLLEASKHFSDTSSYTYDNSPSEFSDEIQMSPVTLTVCKSVVSNVGSHFDDFEDASKTKATVSSEAVGPDVPLDEVQQKEQSQIEEEKVELAEVKTTEVNTDMIKKPSRTADACTGTQTEHILSVLIPKPSPSHRHPEEGKTKSIKMQSTSSQTTSPVSDVEPTADISPVKQTRAKVLIDAAVDATFDSPSFSPLSPMHTAHAKTASIAVGTSPEYSPPSSAPSTDTESVASRSSRVKYIHGGFGSDGDTTDWGASMPFSSIASSSGTSSPERSSSLRSTPLKYLPLETSSLSNTSPPTTRRSRIDRETSTQRGSSAPARTRVMRDSVSSERRTSSSDIDSCDSDGGTPSSTPRKVRRRLPSIPSDQVPVSAPRSSNTHKVFLEKDQNVSDPSKQLELQRVKEMLSRKAASIEKQRREEELRNLRIEADRQRVGAASERIARRRQPKPRGRFYSDGSVSDSEVGPTGSGRTSRDRDRDILDTDWRLGAPALSMQTLSTIDTQQSPTHGARYGLEPPGAPRSTLFLSKSEEDIIREIEKQISETTGKAYQAYDRTEIERDVRRRYGALHDSDRSSSQYSTSSSGSRGSLSDSWSSVTFELPDYRLRAVRQKLKEELKLVTADKRAQLDREAVTNEPKHRPPKGKATSLDLDSSVGFLQSSRANGKPQLLAVPGMDKLDRNGKSSNRLSPQASPQRRRNRRQAADSIPPMFSPIKEDVDIEGDVILSQAKLSKHHSDESDSILSPGGQSSVDVRSYKHRKDGTKESSRDRLSSHELLTGLPSPDGNSSGNRRRRKDTPVSAHVGPEEVDRLSREGEMIEKRIREQQEKEFRREIERRKKQMEDSAKRLDELKIRRGVEWSAASGGDGKSTGTGSVTKPLQGPVKLSQSLDEIARRRDRDSSPLSAERRRYGSLETVARDKGRGARETVSMSTPQLTERERAVIKRDQQGLILPLDEETRLQKGGTEHGKRQTRAGRGDRLERSSSREKRPHRQDSVESVGSNRALSEDDEAGYSDSSKGSTRRRRSADERRIAEESTRHHRDQRHHQQERDHGRTSPAAQRDHGRSSPAAQRDHGRASPATQRDRDHGRTSPATQRDRNHGRTSPATRRDRDQGRASPGSHGRISPAAHYRDGDYHDYSHRRPHNRSREDVTSPEERDRDRDTYADRGRDYHHRQHSRSREDIPSSSSRERARTISPSPIRERDRDSHRDRDTHRDHRRRQHHHSGEDLSKTSKNSDRSSAGPRSRSLPRVLQSERRQASPEDYYYGDQVYRMQASEWTRRADDSGDDEDERRRQAIYQSVPGGSRHMQQRHISRADYQFPTRRFRLPRDPNDKKCRNHGIGMRIIGGKRIPGSEQLVAYIAEIRRGGVADREGLREGDQVLEWCGMPLTGRTYEEVQRITRTADGDVEVVVKCGTNLLESPRQRSRPPDDSAPRSRSTSNPAHYIEEESLEEEAIRNGVDPRMLSERLEGISKAQYVYSSPTTSANTDNSSPKRKGRDRNKKISGEIQIQLDYDERTGDLSVGILRGRGLAPKDINGLADPFVKTCLLPGRGPDNKRKTRYVPKTLTPEWNQTVLYRAVRPQELATRILEISVWDFDRFTFNDFMGQILIDLSDQHILDNRPRWFSLQDQPASTGQQEAFSPRALSPITTLPSAHPAHPLSLLVGRGRGGTTTASGDHGSPERRRALSRSMERVQASSAAQQLMESDSQSSRSSGYEYDTDRSTQSDKSGWSQDHHRDRPSKPPPSSSTQYRHAHNGQHNCKAYPNNGAGRTHTNEKVDHNANHTAKDGSPPKGQPPKPSPTTSANGKPSSISTSVKVTVTTKHPSNKQGSKETKNNTQEKRTKQDTKKQSKPEPKQQAKKEPSRALSPDRTTDRVKLSPSNVRASKPRNEPSIFHYTSTNPSNRRAEKASKKAYDKGASTSKSAQNLSLYHDKPSTSSVIRRSSAELYEGQALERLNGSENLDDERKEEEWIEASKSSADTHTRQPIEVEVIEAGKDDVAEDSKRSQSKEKAGDSALLNGGHDTERVGGVPSLWVRKPQLDLGTSSGLESNSLMQVNLKAAMYTRMFAGDLGPGQIIDPETPRQSDVLLHRGDYDTTGEIRLGLKKESKADGDQLYVEVIQCRKISYKFKTENPPDLYVKGYLVVGDRKVSKKKTHIAKFTKEPKFNEVFMYNTSVTGLALQVSLWADGGRFGRNTLLGDAMIWLDNVNFIPNADSEAWYKLLLASSKSPSSP
ncbi:uncharacterized protein LOC119726383 [Patiria miniata]|uniref:Uncharacterized protein n=1 Tax=Patiria miniata TaxID=46514 RepID=A0A913ZS14_PATMI|nr:uncharacterized protein LOC119726383 [Patiria miniata]